MAISDKRWILIVRLKDYASLRIQLQHHDNLEPLRVRDEFVIMQSVIADFCRDLVPDSRHSIHSTLDILHPEQLKKLDWGPPMSLLKDPTPGTDRAMDDFLECGLLVILNSAIRQAIYAPFHPLINIDRSNCLLEIYDKVRLDEPQIICGRWRVHTFKAIEREFSNAFVEESINALVRRVEKTWLALLNMVYGTWPEVAIELSARKQLVDIVRQAYRWNRMIKSNAIELEFHPRFANHDALFDGDSMHLERRGIKPERIICTLAPGLQSSEARGGGRSPSYRWQEKIRVLF